MNKSSNFMRNYEIITFSTDTARTDFPVHIAGNSILIFSSPVNINVRLHNTSNSLLPMKQYDSLIEKGEDGFEKFFISHAALAGGSIKMTVYTNQNLFLSVGGGAASGGGAATTVGEGSLSLTLAATEYSIALTDNVKRIKLINNSVDAIFNVSLESGNSGSGIPVQPLSYHNIEMVDLVGYALYVQTDIASRTLNYMEML